MQQDNTWQDKGPGKETSKPRQKSKTDKTQDKKARKTVLVYDEDGSGDCTTISKLEKNFMMLIAC